VGQCSGKLFSVMESEKIIISTEFSDSPGARFISDGPNSGEDFLNKLLRPKFILARDKGIKLFIDLDNTWGYASSFISGSFGVLAKEFGTEDVIKILELKSEDDPSEIVKIKAEVNKSPKDAKTDKE